jgi:hypothetical protein
VTSAMITDPRLVNELGIGNTDALAPPVHIERHIPVRPQYQQVWAQVKAS